MLNGRKLLSVVVCPEKKIRDIAICRTYLRVLVRWSEGDYKY